MTELELTKKLISIPSYVDENRGEKALGDFLFGYLSTIPWLKVSKQYVDRDRFNILANTAGTTKLLLGAHMDTVMPSIGQKIKPICSGGKIFGLGSLDTKSGLASIVTAIRNLPDIKGLSLLFYCDEEYDFKGMKTFVNQYQQTKAELAILAEPTNLKIWDAHRGLIEFQVSVKGRGGHAANPKSGINAIKELVYCLNKLEDKLPISSIGRTTMNIAYLEGGILTKNNKNQMQLIGRGNQIADTARALVELRTSSDKINSVLVKKILGKLCTKAELNLEVFEIRQELKPMMASKSPIIKKVKKILSNLGVREIINPSIRGYGDGQILYEKLKIPVIYLGPKGDGAHGPNEQVDCSSIVRLREIYEGIIRNFCY